MFRYYKVYLFFFCAALAAGALYFGFFRAREKTITIARRDLSEEVVTEGMVAAASEVNVGFSVGGKIAEIYVKEGNTVKRDDVLARLDSAGMEAERKQYETKSEVEKLKLSQLLSGASKREVTLVESKITATASALENARKEYEDAKLQADSGLAKQYALAVDYGDTILLNAENAAHALTGIYDEQNKFRGIFIIEDSQKRSEAEWQIMLAHTAFENITLACRRFKQDLSREDIDSMLSNLKTNLEVMRAALQKTAEVLHGATMVFGAPDIGGYQTTVAVQRSVVNATQTEILKFEQNIALQEISGQAAVHAAQNKATETENLLHTLESEFALKKAVTADTAVVFQQAQIKEYEVRREALTRQIADASLRAPFDSVVQRIHMHRGGVVLPDAPVMVLTPLSDLQIDAIVSEEEGKKIKVGNAADVLWQGGKGEGSVANVHDNIITVHFENEETAPALGAQVAVHIHATFRRGVLLVPEQFIRNENGMPYVYIQENGKKKKTAIFVGIEWRGEREVIEGISEGDVLIAP